MRNKLTKHLFLAIALFNYWIFPLHAQRVENSAHLIKKVKDMKLKGDALLADSIAKKYINDQLLKQGNETLYTKENLEFVIQYLDNTHSKAFGLFMKKKETINAILGKNRCEYVLRMVIAREYIPKSDTWATDQPDWRAINKLVSSKFGNIGREVLYGNQMLYFRNIQDWKNFGKYYKAYFETAYMRPEYIVNGLSWKVFEKVSDPEVVKFACDVVMRYAMEEWYQYDPNAYDTYANLLYRLGRKEQAIAWEEKALKIARGNEYFEKQSMAALEKMRKGLITWGEQPNN